MVKIDNFYVNNLNHTSRFYYILDTFDNNYNYIIWDANAGNIKYKEDEQLIDSNLFLYSQDKIEKFYLRKRFIKGIFNDN